MSERLKRRNLTSQMTSFGLVYNHHENNKSSLIKKEREYGATVVPRQQKKYKYHISISVFHIDVFERMYLSLGNIEILS